jgi:hypothetical protein
MRTEMENQKALQDLDMRWIISGGGADGAETPTLSGIPSIDWNPATGVFTITDDIVVQPVSTPSADTQEDHVVSVTDSIPITYDFTFSPMPWVRALNFANILQVNWATDLPAALPSGATAVVSGDPKHILTITVKNDGTTTALQVETAVVAALGALSGSDLLFQYSGSGNTATQIELPIPADYTFSKTAERELHIIEQAVLANFFSADPVNHPLQDGDTLAIWYDEMAEAYPGDGGRRQSIYANNPIQILTSGQLANLTYTPERIPIAIPLCKRIGADLLFIDGTVVAGNLPAGPVTTPFGSHGYVLDLIYGGGIFDDTLYQAWLSVAAASFQDAWDNMIGIFNPALGTGAAAALSIDDSITLTPLYSIATTNLQGAIDGVVGRLDFPAAAHTQPDGGSHVGIDGFTNPGVLVPPLDVWLGLLNTDVWTTFMNLVDAFFDTGGLTGAPGASRVATGANAAPAGASVDRWAIPAGSLQAALQNLQGFNADKASLNEDESVTGDWDFQGIVDLQTTAQLQYGSRAYNQILEGYTPYCYQTSAQVANNGFFMSPGRALVNGKPVIADSGTPIVVPTSLMQGVTLPTTVEPDDELFWMYVWLRSDGNIFCGINWPRNDQNISGSYSTPGIRYYRPATVEVHPGFLPMDYVLCGVIWRYRYDGTNHQFGTVVNVGGGFHRFQNAEYSAGVWVRHKFWAKNLTTGPVASLFVPLKTPVGSIPAGSDIMRSPGIPRGVSSLAQVAFAGDCQNNVGGDHMIVETQSQSGPIPATPMLYPNDGGAPSLWPESKHTILVPNSATPVDLSGSFMVTPDNFNQVGVSYTGIGSPNGFIDLYTLGFWFDRDGGNASQATFINAVTP